ncbi:proteasome regulatory particle subunit [Mayamaea pseudoterrestris]|nr:proteasome regulatory particle subunit [Mayamaea pseudoterrestris]
MSSEGASGSASGGILEEKLDLSSETDAKLAHAKQLAASNQLQEALVLLAALEKRCRVGNDNKSLIRVCKASLDICHDAQDDEALLTTLQGLATKRSQKTAAIKTLVETAMPWCVTEPYTPLAVSSDKKECRDKLVEALRDISNGKIFLERERAILTRVMATIKEEEGDIASAADILQEVHVETYGSLSKRDKVEYILEQMRLTLAKQDFVRSAIVAGKIVRKNLQEENMEEYKVKYFTLYSILHRHEKDALELAKDYHAIYSTSSILKDEIKWRPTLQATIVFLALSPHGNEQQDLLQRIKLDANLEAIPSFQRTIDLLLKKEIINYPLANQAELESLPCFLEGGSDLTKHWHETFHRRIIQHNIRIASLYYKRIHKSRLAQLLQLTPDRLELEIAGMVSDGSVYAKMDRPMDIVRFSSPKSAETVLTEWASDMDKLLHLVETTTHLIHKEQMTAQ